jgi:uncharacterized protein (DUF1697 family)
MGTCIALLRGINVGKAKRIAMADLKKLVAGLGHKHVRTLLNSGNVVFEAPRAGTGKIARELEQAIETRFGFGVKVVVITAAELAAVVDENPLRSVVRNPARCLVAFTATPATLAKIVPLTEVSWPADQLAIGPRAAYLWCAEGILKSELATAFLRFAGDAATTRNWATVLKLQALASVANS